MTQSGSSLTNGVKVLLYGMTFNAKVENGVVLETLKSWLCVCSGNQISFKEDECLQFPAGENNMQRSYLTCPSYYYCRPMTSVEVLLGQVFRSDQWQMTGVTKH